MKRDRALLLVDAIKRVTDLQREIDGLKKEAEALGVGVHMIPVGSETWSITVRKRATGPGYKTTEFEVSVKPANLIN